MFNRFRFNTSAYDPFYVNFCLFCEVRVEIHLLAQCYSSFSVAISEKLVFSPWNWLGTLPFLDGLTYSTGLKGYFHINAIMTLLA
jgi:hypothetical protein